MEAGSRSGWKEARKTAGPPLKDPRSFQQKSASGRWRKCFCLVIFLNEWALGEKHQDLLSLRTGYYKK